MENLDRGYFSFLKLGGSTLAILTVMGIPGVANAQSVGNGGVESVTVTGFRGSLEQALNFKRAASGSVDQILATDLAKFPDTNLAEAIQRVPGVNLSRTGGEGKQIAVRGLSPLFTTTEIDGMETITTSGSDVGRAFDFNVFDSDLFRSITVNKTSSAKLHEGALGATVQLSTPHPFDQPGFTLVGSGLGSYNDMNGGINERINGLVSDTFMGGRLGVLFAGAFQSRKLRTVSTNSVNWQNDNTGQTSNHSSPLIAGCETNVPGAAYQCAIHQRFGSVTVQGTGLPGTIPQVAGTIETSGNNLDGAHYDPSILPNDYDVVNEAYHIRFPRWISGTQSQDRTGFIGSVQYQPDDNTLFTLDTLFADLYEASDNADIVSPAFGISGTGSNLAPRGAPPLKANTLGLGNMNILNYQVDEKRNNLTYLEATNVGLTSERSGSNQDTRYSQVTLSASHSFSPAFKIDGRLGWSESHARTTLAYLFKIDYDCTAATSSTGTIAGCPGGVGGGVGTPSQPYITDARYPVGTFGYSVGQIDPTSSNGWFITQYRNTPVFNYTHYHSMELNASYVMNDEITFEGGADVQNFGYRTQHLARFNGSTASLDSFLPQDLQNADLSTITSTYRLKGKSVPAGTPTAWISPDPNKLSKLFHVFDPTAEKYVWAADTGASGDCVTTGCSAWQLGPGQYLTSNGTVDSNDYAGWFMMDWDSTIGSIPFRGNIGIRYALTELTGQGFNYDPNTKAIVPVTISNTYHDWLPSLNAVLSPVDDFQIRFSAAQVMSRPDLPDLVPGVSASKNGTGALQVGGGNTLLKPYRAKDLDLSFDWYYSTGSLFSVAFFYKHLDNLIAKQNTNVPFDQNPFGIPNSIALAVCGGQFTSFCSDTYPADFSFNVNQKGAPLYGTEINWQQPFDFLPGFWSSFGLLANATFVQAQQKFLSASGVVEAVADLPDMSRTSYNGTFYYDDGVFQARLSVNFRSKYLNSVNPGKGNDLDLTEGSTYFDAAASYKINDSFTLMLQGTNLGNEPVISYYDTIGQRDDNSEWTGREIYLGLRYAY